MAHSSEVEHSPDKGKVEGSLPSVPTSFLGDRLTGRTPDFDSVNLGSNPSPPAKAVFVYRFRIVAFHAIETGSIPVHRAK